MVKYSMVKLKQEMLAVVNNVEHNGVHFRLLVFFIKAIRYK